MEQSYKNKIVRNPGAYTPRLYRTQQTSRNMEGGFGQMLQSSPVTPRYINSGNYLYVADYYNPNKVLSFDGFTSSPYYLRRHKSVAKNKDLKNITTKFGKSKQRRSTTSGSPTKSARCSPAKKSLTDRPRRGGILARKNLTCKHESNRLEMLMNLIYRTPNVDLIENRIDGLIRSNSILDKVEKRVAHSGIKTYRFSPKLLKKIIPKKIKFSKFKYNPPLK